MGKGFFICLAVLVMLSSIALATPPYYPIKERWAYYLNADDFFLLDLDQNGINELYLRIDTKDGKTYINVYNESGDLQWNTYLQGLSITACTGHISEEVWLVQLGDLDHDKNLDIYVSTKVRSESVNLNLFSLAERERDDFNVHKLQVKWEIKQLEGIATDIKTADMNGAGTDEILVSTTEGIIYVLDISGNVQRSIQLEGMVNSIHADDIDGDGQTEIAAATYNGVYYIDGDVVWKYPTFPPSTMIYAAKPIGNESRALILASDKESLQAFSLTGEPRWKIQISGISGIASGDLDNDSSTEIIVASGSSISAYAMNGSFLWSYPMEDVISSMKLLSSNELVAGAKNKGFILETDNRYGKNKSAYELLRRADEAYMDDNCPDATAPAKNALLLFQEIGNIDGELASASLIEKCKGPEETYKLANEYYAIALDAYNTNDYEKAKTYSEKALELFIEIKYYQGVASSDKLRSDIAASEYSYKEGTARQAYEEAYRLYANDQLTEALSELEKAKALYAEINSERGIEECDALYRNIENKVRKIKADEAFGLGTERYAKGEYLDALPLISQAFETYLELNQTTEADAAAELMNQTEQHVQADTYLSEAKDLLASGKYSDVEAKAEAAREIYEGLGESSKVEECENLTADAGNKMRDAQLVGYGMTAAAIILVIAIGFAIHSYLLKRKKA